MLTFTDAQLSAWLSPLLWPFFRALALFMTVPVLSQRAIPARAKIGLAFLVALAAQAWMPQVTPVALDAPDALLVLIQQLLIGATLGFAVRLIFAGMEYAGELIGLQMGLGFAAFFDPAQGGATNAVSRLFGTLSALLFVVINGHLILVAAVVQSFQTFPVGPEPMALPRLLQVHSWGAEVFKLGLWIALPLLAMLIFVNLVLGVISRVAQQMNIFAIGFPITVSVGLLGLLLTLPTMEQPFVMAIERALSHFR
ncbi:MAG: flagellar biosynthetic protein FliR [Caldimonas sp.]|uniref:flagellar biosynthetic protein FliR n=1 Tax=Caldimonas taiwanensis TaxID=307483 RepID=UPI000783A32A|nr:flagellar biosynthetic protein FliR [Caldimonas taiwanensis]GIX25700.1 MAG: flagellar biosynthetic protein FliR [Caldimonas sp.]